MKKIIFGSASAILAVIGFSSFKNTKAAGPSYYWFNASGSALPVSTPTDITFSQAGTYVAFETVSAALETNTCGGATDLCLVGYTLSSISGFNALHHPTGFKTNGSGNPKPYATRGGTAINE